MIERTIFPWLTLVLNYRPRLVVPPPAAALIYRERKLCVPRQRPLASGASLALAAIQQIGFPVVVNSNSMQLC